MPLYEYYCESCGRTIEVFQSFSERPLSTCDRCGGAVKRLLSPPAIQFKGSGWYVSDYGRSGGSGGKAGSGGAEGEGTKGPAADTTSKDSSGGSPSKQGS